MAKATSNFPSTHGDFLHLFGFERNRAETNLRAICRAEMATKKLESIMCDLEDSRTYQMLEEKFYSMAQLYREDKELDPRGSDLGISPKILLTFAAHIYAAGALLPSLVVEEEVLRG